MSKALIALDHYVIDIKNGNILEKSSAVAHSHRRARDLISAFQMRSINKYSQYHTAVWTIKRSSRVRSHKEKPYILAVWTDDGIVQSKYWSKELDISQLVSESRSLQEDDHS